MDIHAYEWETWILQILGETAYCYVFLGGNSSLMWHYWALLNPLLLYEEQSDLIDKLGKIKLSMFSSWLSCLGKEYIATEYPLFLQQKLSSCVEIIQVSVTGWSWLPISGLC